MAQQSPPAERWVDIFTSAHEGYGDSRRSVRQYSYNRVAGSMDPRVPGEVSILDVAATGQGVSAPSTFIAEWEDTVPDPIVLVGSADLIYTLKAGAATSASASATITDGVLHDDGSGVPYLYTALGGAGSTKVRKRNRAATITACTNLVAEKLLSLNNDLYISAQPASGTAICAVGKVPAGTDPTSAAQPALTVVGFATTKINNIVADGEGRAPVCLKPEGIYGYDRALALWRTIGRIQFHPDNGKAYWYEQGDLCVSLGAGGAVRVHGTQLIPWDPIPRSATPDESTTVQIITAACSLQNGAMLLTKPGGKRQLAGAAPNYTNIGCRKTADNGANWTDYSAAVSDGDPTTYADLSSIDTLANGDYIVVGHEQPFCGVYVDLLAANSNTATLTVEIWTGAAWASLAVRDLTNQVKTLQQSGWVLATADPIAAGWVANSINGIGQTRYWMRFSFSAALSAAVKIKAFGVLPWRPTIDATLAPLDGLDRAGVFPHLLYSHVDDAGRHVVHDLGNMGWTTPDEYTVMAYAAGPSLNGEERVLTYGGRKVIAWLGLPASDQPAMEPWPLQNASTTQLNIIEWPSVDLGGVAKFAEIEVEGRAWTTANGYLFYRYDDGRGWRPAGRFDTLPWRGLVQCEHAGPSLKVAVILKPTSRYATRRLRLTRIRARVVSAERESPHLPATTPPVV